MVDHYEVQNLEIQTQHLFDTRTRSDAIDKFIDALKQEMPYLKFRSARNWDGNEVAVYCEGDALARGWIAYGDYTPAAEVKQRYTIYSHSITNGKYKSGTKQSNMAMTEDLSKAVKLVKKHLRPVPTVEVAKYSIPSVNHRYSRLHEDTRKSLDAARLAIVGNVGNVQPFIGKPLENALSTLLMQGITIGDKDFTQQVENYFTYKAKYSEAINFTGNMYFVHPQMKFNEPVYNVVPITWDQPVASHWPKFSVLEGLSAAYLEARGTDMEAIKDRIAALYLMQSAEFVHGVGMRVDANRYFVVV
jgi:hypothetical protein